MSRCFLVVPKIVVVYIYPSIGGKWDGYAKRFSLQFQKFHSSLPHRIIVVANGAKPNPRMEKAIGDLKCEWFRHDNEGWDIGAYQRLAPMLDEDLMICFGASTYFRKAGWMERIVEAEQKHGLALYGAMGNRGDLGRKVWPHIRTSSFWMHPKLLAEYPIKVKALKQRYEFEHGWTSISEWARSIPLKRLVVTFDGEYEWDDWSRIKNGYHIGNQSNLLCGDRLTEPPFYHIP